MNHSMPNFYEDKFSLELDPDNKLGNLHSFEKDANRLISFPKSRVRHILIHIA